MYLGIEIGGTKLQIGVGAGEGPPLLALERFDVEPAQGALGILERIRVVGRELIARHGVRAIGIGFGGPIEAKRGRIIKSHHVEGWTDFPLVDWCRETFGLGAVLGNDADLAGLAEARFGAGRGFDPVFYVTIGTGIGGGLIVHGDVYRGNGAGAAELGHLRLGPSADKPEETVESIASGWGIAAAAQAYLQGNISHHLLAFRAESRPKPRDVRQQLIKLEEVTEEHAADLRRRCESDLDRLTARIVGEAAANKNLLALEILAHAWQVLGWAIGQTVTLVSPSIVVIGGGVSLLGDELLFRPLREAVRRYVFPPFADTFQIVPAQLGEEMVVHGALAFSRSASTF